jgi:nitroreductase
MDAIELLKTRKSVSSAFLAAPGPSQSELSEMLTIAARVPDHGKLVPWRFIVFREGAGAEAGELPPTSMFARTPAPTPRR